MTEPLYWPEYVDGAYAVICDHLLPRLRLLSDVSAPQVARALAAVKGHPMAEASIEVALLDAELSARDESFTSYLGGLGESAPSGVSVGIMASIPELLDAVDGYLDQGYLRIKLKIGPNGTSNRCGPSAKQFGSSLLLQVDANPGGWHIEGDTIPRRSGRSKPISVAIFTARSKPLLDHTHALLDTPWRRANRRGRPYGDW